MSLEYVNIVILGCSFAGLSVAHNFIQNTLPELRSTGSAPKYRLVVISPSTHLYWNIGAPRAIVSPDLVPLSANFVPIEEGFKRYPKDTFAFVQGTAIAVDTIQRLVTVALVSPEDEHRTSTASPKPNRWPSVSGNTQEPRIGTTQLVPYHALIVATGSSHESPLLSLHGPHERTMADLKTFHARIPEAESIIVAGGGPSGVESAGQIATYFNTTAKWPPERHGHKKSASMDATGKRNFLGRTSASLKRRWTSSTAQLSRKPKTITLISGNDRLLPNLHPKLSANAEKKLKDLGVHIMHNTRLLSAQETPGGKTRCVLSNDITIAADLYVAATGVRPNTAFLSTDLVDVSGAVITDPETLRVDRAGERVYAVGDCASYSKRYVLDVYEAVPILMHNLRNDLVAFEIGIEGGAGAEEEIAKLEDARYLQNPTDTQLIPITRRGGVGVIYGHRLPSLMVHLMKGRDYGIKKAKGVVEKGYDPYGAEAYVDQGTGRFDVEVEE